MKFWKNLTFFASSCAEYFLETHRHLFETHDELYGAEQSDTGLYQSTDIQTFHNLVTHDNDGQKQPPGNFYSSLKFTALFSSFLYSGVVVNNTQDCDEHLFRQVSTCTGRHQLPIWFLFRWYLIRYYLTLLSSLLISGLFILAINNEEKYFG